MAAVLIAASDGLRVQVPIKNIGTALGNFTLTGKILNKSNVQVGQLALQGTSNMAPNLPIEMGQTGAFVMEKLNWANGDPYGFAAGELLDVLWEVLVIETGLKTTVKDVDAIQHFRGVPEAQFLPRTYTVIKA